MIVASFVPQDTTPNVPLGDQLTPRQRQELHELVARNQDIFATTPGHTTLIEHDIITEPGKRVKLRPYRVPEARRQIIPEEVQKMLGLGIIAESHSA